VTTTVAVNGCFDCLHPGHVAFLSQARLLGSRLVVLLNSDASVRRLKGLGRPIYPKRVRVAMLRTLRCVDQVIVFGEDDACLALESLKPDVLAKGWDCPDPFAEETTAIELGIKIVRLGREGDWSTTKLLEAGT
jgi:D-beta-D-heptose 7-phosphate kinase / D-beta-D-heptose 1-phosphate adenosyltransferase